MQKFVIETVISSLGTRPVEILITGGGDIRINILIDVLFHLLFIAIPAFSYEVIRFSGVQSLIRCSKICLNSI